MTNEELQTVVVTVIQALKTNGKTIAQLTPVTSLANSDSLEVSGGKKIAFSKLKELVASAVVITEKSIKSWVVIESTDDLPKEPTPEEQTKAYVLADESTLYVYVGEGGDTLGGSYQSVNMKGPKGESGVDLGEVVLVNDLTTGGEMNALSAEMGKELKGMIDNVGIKHGTFADALDAVLASNSVFEWMLVDEVDSDVLIKPLWHVNGSLVDAAGAVVSLATLTAPVFSRDSGDVYIGTTITITCPSGSTLYYSVNGIAATSTSDVTITINEASVVKGFLKSGDAVSDIVAKSYGIAVDHKFQFKIKLTGDNSTEYVPVASSGSPRYTMTVDWGDGSTPSEYTNKYFSSKGCGHTYSGTAGDEFVITLRGTAIPYLGFVEPQLCNTGALVAILDNTLKCQTGFSAGRNALVGGFKNCINLESLSANALSNNYGSPNIYFQGTKLTSLPTGFFANLANLNGCSNMFYGTSIILTAENISELKTAIKNVTDFSTMFYGFKGSVTLPDDFFDSVTATITNLWAFSHTATAASISGDAKALYDVLVQKVSQSANTQYCFSCTGFSNRNQVPNAWGGTAD